jgi:hypothetical protein
MKKINLGYSIPASIGLLLLVSYGVFACKKKEKEKPPIVLSDNKRIQDLVLVKSDIATLSYVEATKTEFLEQAKGYVNINSPIQPIPETWLDIKLADENASYAWTKGKEPKQWILRVTAENESTTDYHVKWHEIKTDAVGVANISIQGEYIFDDSFDFSEIKNNDKVNFYGVAQPKTEHISITHLDAQAQKNIVILEGKNNTWEVTLESHDKTKKLIFSLIFNLPTIEVDFTSPIETDQNKVVFVDIDHTNVVLKMKKHKEFVKSYQYKIYKQGTSDAIFTSSVINYNQEQEIPIDINVSQFLTGNTIFNSTNFSISVESTTAIGTQSFSKDIEYHYVVESNIPIIDIQVQSGQEPPQDKTKLNADYTVFDALDNGMYSLSKTSNKKVSGTINVRGNTSVYFPKKSYTMSLSAKMEVLGFPTHNKWTLIGGWVDKTYLANYTVYTLYRQMGHYAQREKQAIIYVNGNYRGLYSFLEKIEQGENRVPTAKSSAGGFILDLVRIYDDFTMDGMAYAYNYPSSPTPIELDNIKITLKRYHDALINGNDWRQYYSEEAQIDLFILTDVFFNPDNYSNTKNVIYFLNERNNKIEPIAYDFVASFVPDMYNWWPSLNANSDILYSMDENEYPFISYYRADPNFTKNLKKRYTELRQDLLSDASILGIMQPVIDKLNDGKHYEKNQKRWTDLNSERYTPEQFKQKLLDRLEFLDSKWKN